MKVNDEYTCVLGHQHRWPCLSTHGAAGGTRNGLCDYCHLPIFDGAQQLSWAARARNPEDFISHTITDDEGRPYTP